LRVINAKTGQVTPGKKVKKGAKLKVERQGANGIGRCE